MKKSQKLFFWDGSRVPAPAARVENLVLSHLLRLVHWLERARVPFAFQVALDGAIDRRLPDVNGARVRQVPLTRFLSSLP